MDLNAYMARSAAGVNAALPEFIDKLKSAQPRLAEAMKYSLCAGGKRLRPVLMGAAYEVFGGRSAAILPAACALEMLHTYSLIHDDLPVMDNDDLRRGRPTSHKVYGEALALLAGDALLTDAFTVLLASKYPGGVKPEYVLAAAGIMARRAGACGMVSGQAADLKAEGFLDGAALSPARRRLGLRLLSYIHRHKTADLICAAAEMGAALAGAPAADFAALSAFGSETGLCFQITDDILDVAGDKKKLGKKGSDAANHKLTYVSLLGVPAARSGARASLGRALLSLKKVRGAAGPKNVLGAVARFACKRDN